MYNFLINANNKIWNNNFSEGEKMLEETKNVVPQSSFLFLMGGFLKFYISGEDELKDEISKRLDFCENLIKNYQKSAEEREILIDFIFEKNENTKVIEVDYKRISVLDKELIIYNETTTEEVIKFSKIPENILKKEIRNSLNDDLEASRGLVLLLRGTMQLHEQRYIKGAWSLRCAWKVFQSLSSKLDQIDNVDVIEKVEFGYGVFLFLVSILPDMVKRILYWVGFKYDREKGVKLLKRSLNRQRFLVGYSTLFLLINYVFMPSGIDNHLERLSKVKPILDFVISLYPNASLFRMFTGLYATKLNQMKKAIEHFDLAIQSCGNMEPNNYRRGKSFCYFFLFDYENAALELEKIVKSKKIEKLETNFLCFSMLAICYINLGKSEEECLKTLNLSYVYMKKKSKSKLKKYVNENFEGIKRFCLRDDYKGESDFLFKFIIFKKLRTFMNLKMFELFYLQRHLAHLDEKSAEEMHRKFKEFFSEENMKSFGRNPEISIAIICIEAQLLSRMGKKKDSMELFKKFRNYENKIKLDKHYIAFCKYEVGELLYHEGKYEESLRWMKEAKKCSKYVFETVLKARISIAMSQIKEKIKNKTKK